MDNGDEGKYLYCIIAAKKPKSFGPIGIGERGDEVYTVHYKDLAVVVSNSPIITYAPTKTYALAHEKVIAEVMKEYTVIPISFGVICSNDDEIHVLVKHAYKEIKKVLPSLKNRIELGLKVFWKKESFAGEIEKGDKEIARLKQEIASKPPQKTYYDKINLGTLVQSAVEEKRRLLTEEIYDHLKDFAVDSRLNDCVGVRMVINSAYLVERDREPKFDEEVNKLYLKYSDRLVFKYSGPWPPYNFIGIKLKFEE